MSRLEKLFAGIIASIVAAGVPAGVSAYVSLAAAQAAQAERLENVDDETRYQRHRIEDTLHNIARICERLGVTDCRSSGR